MRGDDWGNLYGTCVEGSMKFWKKKNFLEKAFAKGHFNKFEKNPGYA